MSAESHLATLGITIQQANDFILSHLEEPSTIFNTAKEFGVTTSMLNEITGYSTNDIRDYFASFGLNTAELDNDLSGERALLAPDLQPLVNFLTFNEDSGILSTASLRDSIIAKTNANDYSTLFDPGTIKGASDGVFTPGELGTGHLGNVSATAETLESLFYGTLISTSRAIDEQEAEQINAFLAANPDEHENETVSSSYIELALSVYGDPAPRPAYSDREIAIFTVEIGVEMIGFVGVAKDAALLDHALLF